MQKREGEGFTTSHSASNGLRGRFCSYVYAYVQMANMLADTATGPCSEVAAWASFWSVVHTYGQRRKFNTAIQPAKAYEDESVMLSGPHRQWPTREHKQTSGPCAT